MLLMKIHYHWWFCLIKIGTRWVSLYYLHCRLAEMGYSVGSHLLDALFVREKGYKREIKLLQMLLFVKTAVWKVRNT